MKERARNVLFTLECGHCTSSDKPLSSRFRGAYKVLANQKGLMRLRCRRCSSIYLFRVKPANDLAKRWFYTSAVELGNNQRKPL